MAKRGGNRLRNKGLESRVQVEPRTLLNLLKSLPGVFGDLPGDQVDSLDPALIFRGEKRYECYFNPSEVSSTRPFAHSVLASFVEAPLEKTVKAYLVGSSVGKFLFPSTEDLSRDRQPEGESLTDQMVAMQNDFLGRAEISMGGVSGGSVADLFSVVKVVRGQLEKSHKGRVDFMAAQPACREVLGYSLQEEKAEA